MTTEQENIALKKQLLSAYINNYYAVKAAEQAAYEAKDAVGQVAKIRKEMNKTIEARVTKESERLNKIRNEAILALSALNEEAAKHVKEAITNG